ncbi:MAG TPA: hypothetical protein VKQ52_12840, partial [Puia sp.]|nr:hypothetical protein [Puia sp.]
MHASIGFNRSIAHVLDYNEQKVEQNLGECIWAENFARDYTSLTYNEKFHRFQQRASLNDTIKRNMYHTALRFGATEHLSNDKM